MAMLNNQRVKLHYPPSLPAFFDKPSRCNSSSLSKPSWLSSTALKIPWCILTSENSGAKIQSISIHKHCGDWWGYQGTDYICQCIHTCIYKDGTSIANNYPLVILELCPITALYTIGLSSSLRKVGYLARPNVTIWLVKPSLKLSSLGSSSQIVVFQNWDTPFYRCFQQRAITCFFEYPSLGNPGNPAKIGLVRK